MTTYRCRAIKPEVSGWADVPADTPEEAAQAFQYDHPHLCVSLTRRADNGDPQDVVKWARVEVEGHGTWIARTFQTGIYRRGGVLPPGSGDPLSYQLVRVAQALDWKGDPMELIADGWDLEESWDAASQRKWAAREPTKEESTS